MQPLDAPHGRSVPSSDSANPFLAGAVLETERGDHEPREALVERSAPVPADEVELPGVPAIEARLSWGDNALHVVHATPMRSLYAGEQEDENLPLDFFVPAKTLGAARMPIVLHDANGTRVVLPRNAIGHLEQLGGPRVSLARLRASAAPCVEVPGAVCADITEGTRVEMTIGDFVFAVSIVPAGKPVRRGYGAAADRLLAGYLAASFVAAGALLASMAYFTPDLGLLDDESMNRDRLYLMQQYLRAAAERNERLDPPPPTDDASETGRAGERAAGEEGSAGKPTSKNENRHLAVKGPSENVDPHVSRHAALREAMSFGMLGVLQTAEGDLEAFSSPFARESTLGSDALSAMGNLFGGELGEAHGTGLALSSLGEGGGGRGRGIGLKHVGTLGNGFGDRGGFGDGHGRPTGTHASVAPRMRPGTLDLSGRLPPEVVQRIVRQNYGRFRLCYERGLLKNPNLQGRVTARFVIDRTGVVSTVANGGSDIPSSDVTACVLGAFYGLSFPEPDNGIVTVSYPILFTPG